MPYPRDHRRRLRVGLVRPVAAVGALALGVSLLAWSADTAAIADPIASPSASPTGTTSPTPSTAAPTPTASASPTASPSPSPKPSAPADPGTASVVLSYPAVSDGITAYPGNNYLTDPQTVATQKGGRACWEVGTGSGDYAVYAAIDAAYKHSGANNATIAVDYYDEATTSFAIQYDQTSDPFHNALTTTETGTRQWKTASVFVTDALFQNRESGFDLRVSTYDPSFGQSQGPLCIGAIRVTPSAVPTQDVRVLIPGTGAVYAPGKAIDFDLQSVADSVRWSIWSLDGDRAGRGTVTVDPTVHTARIDAGTLPVGSYTLELVAERSGAALATRDVDFAVSAGDVAASPSGFFAMNTHNSRLDVQDRTTVTEATAHAGIASLREDAAYWNTIEQSPGVYTFDSANDATIHQIAASGQQPLVLLGFSNGLYDGGNTPYTDAGIEAAGRYAAAVAEHYESDHVALEVWNEYYGGFSNGPCAQSPQCYAKLLASVYQHVKAVSPDTEIVGASSFKVPLDWFQTLFDLGGLSHLDAVSVHPYRSPGKPEGLEKDIASLQALMAQHGTVKPIWITEQGWVTQPGGVGVSERTQADYIARSALLALGAGVQRYYWYDMLNDGSDPQNAEANFGLLATASAAASGITPKPSYLAYQTASRLLGAATFRRADAAGDPTVFAYRLDDRGHPVEALWTDADDPRTVTVQSGGPVTLTDMLGATRSLTPVDGRITLSLSGDPVYLTGAAVSRVRVASAATISAPSTPVTASAEIPIRVGFDPSALGLRGGTAVFTVEGRRVTATSFGGRIEVQTTVPSLGRVGDRVITATVSIGDRVVGTAQTSVQVVPDPVRVDVAPALVRSAGGLAEQLAVTLTNTDPRHGLTLRSVDWSYGDQSGTLTQPVVLAPGATRQVSVAIRHVDYYRPVDVAVTAHPQAAAAVTVTRNFGFSPVTPATPRLTAAGFRGLDGVPAIDLATVGSYGGSTTASQLSGTFWLSYDRSALYVAADVVQPDLSVTPNPLWLQAGDNVGIGIQPGRAASGIGDWGAQWYNIYAGMTADGPAAFLESLPLTSAVGVKPDIVTTVIRDDATQHTRYLVRIPWSEIPGVSPGSGAFSMTLDADRNDRSGAPGWRGAGLAGWEQWAAGLNTFELAKYQTVVFAPSGRS